MEISEIIKKAFVFPAKNLETLSIYAILSLFGAAFVFEGVVTLIFGIIDIWNIVIGAIYIIIAIIIGIFVGRISIQCVKSGIELQEKLPDFKWTESFGLGFKKIIITIFYLIIPAIITVFIGLITNVFGNLMNIGQAIVTMVPSVLNGSVTVPDAIYASIFPLLVSLTVTITIGLILFLIFSFFQAMGEAKLAHTGSLKSALNVYAAVKDLSRIGVSKLVLLSILIFVILVAIEAVLMVIFDHLVVLSVLTIIITPYLAFFSQSALGLLYSDIV